MVPRDGSFVTQMITGYRHQQLVGNVQVVEHEGKLPTSVEAFFPDAVPAVQPPATLQGLSSLADRSARAVSERLQVEHLNCEEAELSIIHGFMQQLTKQVSFLCASADWRDCLSSEPHAAWRSQVPWGSCLMGGRVIACTARCGICVRLRDVVK